MFKQLLKIGLSVGVSFAILALLLQMVSTGVDDAQRPSILTALQNTSLLLVGAYLLLYLVTLAIRAYRYRLLLGLSGEPNLPTMRQMLLVTGIRNMVVDMLPARAGELGYVAILNRAYGVKLEHCVSSLAISIAFDFVALLAVVFAIVAVQIIGVGVQGWALGALIIASLLSVIAVFGLFVIAPWFTKLVSKRFAWSEDSLLGKGLLLLQKFSLSLQQVRNSGQSGKVVLVSIVIRALKYLGFYLLFRAVALPNFPALAELPTGHVVGALIGGEVGASLPIPTFMSFGAYEAGSALVFQLLGVTDQAAAVVTMLCVHIWSQVMEYSIGGLLVALFIWITRKGKTAVAQTRDSSPKRALAMNALSFVGAGIVLMLGSGFLAYQLWAASKLGALKAPDAGGVASDVGEWRDLSKEHVSRLDGFVVFSSNRGGNHDIFRLDLKSFTLDKLTDHPHTETYPRISPDGEQLVFARAHQEWVSQRNTVAWDVFVLDLDTGQERKVGENGTAPHWLSNTEITYLHQATMVKKVDVNTGDSSIIFESGVENQLPKGAQLQNPNVNPVTGQVTFTARQSHIGSNTGHWGTALDTNGRHRGVLNGCELAWTSDGASLYQVNPGGEFGDLQIVQVDPQTLSSEVLIDLEGEFSHEYWPKDSSNGQYMVFGASRSKKDHEHDTKDYEIFLWKVGSDSKKATRLTFHTGNDNWPDVFIR